MSTLEKGIRIIAENQYNIDLTFARSALIVLVTVSFILIFILFNNEV